MAELRPTGPRFAPIAAIWRDKNGLPKFNDPNNVSAEDFAALSDSEREYLRSLQDATQSAAEE